MTLSDSKRQLLESWKRGAVGGFADSRIAPRPAGTEVPMSLRQAAGFKQRVWSREELVSDANIFFAGWLRGPLDTVALELAVTELVRRHESLRSTVGVADDHLFLEIAPEPRGSIDRVEVGHLPPDEVLAACTAFVREPFDLVVGPLARMRLFRFDDQLHVLAMVVHHLVADGSSLTVALTELAELYTAAAAGRPSALRPPLGQFGDFAIWQHQRDRSGLAERDVEYWRPRLTGVRPLDFGVVTDPDATGAGSRPVRLSPAETTVARDRCRDENVSLFMLLLAAAVIGVSRLTGEDDIAFGCEVDNRMLPETESMIGYLVNVIVLRNDLGGDPTLGEVLDQVAATCRGAYAHAATPIESIIEAVFPGADPSTVPLFQVHMILQPRLPVVPLGEVELEPIETPFFDCWYDLELHLWQDVDDVWGEVKFDRSRVPDAVAERLQQELPFWIDAIASEPGLRLSAAAERLSESGRRGGDGRSPTSATPAGPGRP